MRSKGWTPQFSQLTELISQPPKTPSPEMQPEKMLARIGQGVIVIGEQALALLGFLGESAVALGGNMTLMGIVIANQTSDQLRQFGANIFVADLVGLSMLREFAPLMTAIIVAGRFGSAYAAQIGTMSVSDEIDAMRASLVDATSRRVIATRDFEGLVKASSDDPYGGVLAANQTVQAVLGKLAELGAESVLACWFLSA